MSAERTHPDGDAGVWTIPNLLSFARLLGVPLFLWLILTEQDAWAIGVLVVASLTDWLDGRLARALNQTSRLGTLLDPAADRLYIFATLVGLTVREIIPLWLLVLLVAREVAIVPIAPITRRLGYRGALPVHFVGKAATLCLLYAFPLLLLGAYDGTAATVARVVGWAFAIWGTALYWWGALLYWEQTRRLVGSARAVPSPATAEQKPDPSGDDPDPPQDRGNDDQGARSSR